jgi:hypothetical protein
VESPRVSGVGTILGEQDGDFGVAVPDDLLLTKVSVPRVYGGNDHNCSYKAIEAIQAFAEISVRCKSIALWTVSTCKFRIDSARGLAYSPKVDTTALVSIRQVVQDLDVSIVLASAKPDGQGALAGSLMLQLHVFLQVPYDGSDDRCTYLGADIVDQAVSDQKAERVREAGHLVYLAEKYIESVRLVRSLGIRARDGVVKM